MRTDNDPPKVDTSAIDLIPMFGADAGSPRMEAIYERLGMMKRPRLPEDDADAYYDWMLVRRQGVELGFAEENHHLGAPRERWRKGSLLFVQAYFYAGMNDVARCAWPLPHGIHWGESREQVRLHMAAHQSTLHSSMASDAWDVPGYRITVAYAGEVPQAERVFCRQMPVDLDAPADTAPPPLAKIIENWGGSVARADWRRLWRTWLDDEAVSRAVEDGQIDLTASFGVTLHVNADGGEPLLRAVTLHRNRDTDSVGWRGSLPLGLSFDDSPDALFAKIPRKPESAQHGSTTGHAVWQFAEYTLHVLYSCVDNRLLRVKLLAPGVWKSIRS